MNKINKIKIKKALPDNQLPCQRSNQELCLCRKTQFSESSVRTRIQSSLVFFLLHLMPGVGDSDFDWIDYVDVDCDSEFDWIDFVVEISGFGSSSV